ncbi:Xaa-Pro dipeptidase [Reinekea sp.]|jgi:Xaa-Pro dipeptidase|uniref:Xaa-Pro dipeptidase n=1 Tax=Reinekea sp. TaxID=1970455 RepID=UPI002A808D59|nr:Xaa-Pro dipeptidase [Reinekea sp.]
MSLYQDHLQTLMLRYQQACEQFQLDAIAVHAGSLTHYALDDLSHPFHPAAFAQQWLPYDLPANTWVLYSPTQGLSLYWPAKQDFWHVSPAAPFGEWSGQWRIIAAVDTGWLTDLPGRVAVISNSPNALAKVLARRNRLIMNPEHLTHWLNFDRAVKTEWEIEQLRRANQRALLGHAAAEQAFLAGQSEMEIHRAYLCATEQQQIDEPYGAIVGLNESAAVLHYERKNLIRPDQARTLLIDAGVKVNGYGSDITRTFTTDQGVFKELVERVDTFQRQLVELCQVGTPYLDIHEAALRYSAETLRATGICSLSVEEQLDKQITQVFFPHGIGHLLGLQVHDVGGHQQDRSGMVEKPPKHAPFLRLTRPLAEGTVITIEPGLYFIPMLLTKMQAEIGKHGCDLALIEQLKPYGGARIEDNIAVRSTGPENLSRP